MIKHKVLSVIGTVACVLLAASTAACGFGTKPGPPYDFTQLEPVANPILQMPFVSLLSREESGTDCHTQGCGRPRLVYRLRIEALSNCARVQELIAAFRDVTEPFSVANPGRCGYAGEVDGHSVTIAGHDSAGDTVTPGGSVDHLVLAIFADKLSVPPSDPSRRS